jgi:hypothetical protein
LLDQGVAIMEIVNNIRESEACRGQRGRVMAS